MKVEIGAYEAKTRLPELLRQVQAGKQFTITNRGKAIADLIPSRAHAPKDPAAAIDKFLAFMKANPVRVRVDIKALIEEGRE
ncbi:MAG: type II toxin-antitoxin system prevent-host-death family antitoxin [Proteobacteria bacterium]|nr:type II toxin-antitoxin system prevent-host-death family antitoxin [Pseudomonadota bacterium]